MLVAVLTTIHSFTVTVYFFVLTYTCTFTVTASLTHIMPHTHTYTSYNHTATHTHITDGTPHSKLTAIAQTDLKGWLPQSVIHMTMSSIFRDSARSLLTYLQKNNTK